MVVESSDPVMRAMVEEEEEDKSDENFEDMVSF